MLSVHPASLYLLQRFVRHLLWLGAGLLLLTGGYLSLHLSALAPSLPLSLELLMLPVWCLPAALPVVLPASLLLATLATVYQLQATHAALGLMSLGYSRYNLLGPLLACSLLLLPLALASSLSLDPLARSQARRLLLTLEGDALARQVMQGQTTPLGPHFLIQPLRSGGYLIQDDRDRAHPLRWLAQTLTLDWQPSTLMLHLVFQHGQIIHMTSDNTFNSVSKNTLFGSSKHTFNETSTLDSLSFDTLTLDLPLDAQRFKRDLFDLNTPELTRRVQTTQARGQDATFERLTLTRRYAQPLSLPAWVVLGFVLSPSPGSRRRATSAPALPWAASAGLLLGFYLSSRLIDGLARPLLHTWQLEPELLGWLPTLLLLVLALSLLLRLKD